MTTCHNFDTLNTLVTHAICKAEDLQRDADSGLAEAGLRASIAWAAVSAIEEEIAHNLQASDLEREIGFRGAVEAAEKAGLQHRVIALKQAGIARLPIEPQRG